MTTTSVITAPRLSSCILWLDWIVGCMREEASWLSKTKESTIWSWLIKDVCTYMATMLSKMRRCFALKLWQFPKDHGMETTKYFLTSPQIGILRPDSTIRRVKGVCHQTRCKCMSLQLLNFKMCVINTQNSESSSWWDPWSGEPTLRRRLMRTFKKFW